MYGLPGANFHRSHQRSTALCPEPKLDKKTWKVRRETHLRPYAKLEFYCTNFYKTHNDSLNCCGHLPYRILSTSEESVENTAEFSFAPIRKIWRSLCVFSQSSKMFGINKCRFFCVKFNWNRSVNMKNARKTHLFTPLSKVGLPVSTKRTILLQLPVMTPILTMRRTWPTEVVYIHNAFFFVSWLK